MRLERLIIDSGGQTLATDFHPRLTVIGGLDPRMRASIVGEVLDSLAGARPGVHLELQTRGRSLTVFRPNGGRHRVVDTDRVADVTASHLDDAGEIDLLAPVAGDRAQARRLMRLTRADLVVRSESDAWIARLAAIDQPALWAAADRCIQADDAVVDVSTDAGASEADAALLGLVEDRHAEFVAATDRYERIRLIALTLGTVGALASLGTVSVRQDLSGLPFLALTVVGAVLAWVFRRRVNRAEADEREVLARAGADDYSSFQFQRVSELLDGDEERRRFMLAVSDQAQARAEWRELTGDVPLGFAREHERQIRAAAELQSGVGTLRLVSAEAPELEAASAAELARALVARCDELRALSPGDHLPLVVDDPFESMEPAIKPMLLEMLSAQSRDVQLIVVTADPDVTSWARVESMTGDVAIVEPSLDRVGT